jgi:glycosyltransferase involved in cell wall biosynthesis
MTRFPLILTTGIRGEDGLSFLSREVRSAFEKRLGRVDVWSLTDPQTESTPRFANGNRVRFSAWALEEGFLPQYERIIATLHAHLLPLALPMTLRGARLLHVLVGIESWKRLSAFQAAALRRAWRIAAISEYSAVEFRRANPEFAGTEISICHPGIPDCTDSSSDRAGTYALIVGRMSSEERYKGHDLILEVWGEVRSRLPDVELRVAGDGDDRPRLEEKAKRMGLDRSVRFLGKVSSEELGSLYRGCAFFVMPSRSEGFGLVFLEAMRAGKAAIGALGAASEIIDDGVTGYVVNPNNREALIDAIATLWTDKGTRERMGVNGRRRFLDRFTRERFDERISRLLESG